MRIIFLGPPGSGKGTQACLISKRYNIPNISTGNILRDLSHKDKSIFRSINYDNIKNLMYSGNLIDDNLIIELIIERVHQDDCKNGFLLDGFPRTIMQAISIKKNNVFINVVIEFFIPDDIIIDRIVGRQTHPASGRIYHVKLNPPKFYGLDDITGEKLVIREDDNKKSVYNRLYQYHQYTAPLSQYYRNESEKGNMNYFMINANRDIFIIYKELINIL